MEILTTEQQQQQNNNNKKKFFYTLTKQQRIFLRDFYDVKSMTIKNMQDTLKIYNIR